MSRVEWRIKSKPDRDGWAIPV